MALLNLGGPGKSNVGMSELLPQTQKDTSGAPQRKSLTSDISRDVLRKRAGRKNLKLAPNFKRFKYIFHNANTVKVYSFTLNTYL